MVKTSKVLSSYVPRHMRLGVCVDTPVIHGFTTVIESVPILDNCGKVVSTDYFRKTVPVTDIQSQFKLSQFRLTSLIEAGVPLNVVNLNNSRSFTIDQLDRICQSIDGADKFVEQCLKQEEERKSWFKDFEESASDGVSNVENVES